MKPHIILKAHRVDENLYTFRSPVIYKLLCFSSRRITQARLYILETCKFQYYCLFTYVQLLQFFKCVQYWSKTLKSFGCLKKFANCSFTKNYFPNFLCVHAFKIHYFKYLHRCIVPSGSIVPTGSKSHWK